MNDVPTVIAEKIPKHQRERLAAVLLNSVRNAFEDPKIQKEFEDWKSRKNQANKETNDELTRRSE